MSVGERFGLGLSSLDKQLGNVKDGGRLQLSNQLVHKPLRVGARVEIVMVDSFNKNLSRFRSYPWDVLLSCVIRAGLVRCGYEHSDWYPLYVLKRNERCLELACQPLLVGLFFLEALDCRVAIHRPVDFGLDSLPHIACDRFVIVTNLTGKVVAKSLPISFPIWSIDGVDA